jgi:ATP-dependent Clp protease ATP-binding subunit ClpC
MWQFFTERGKKVIQLAHRKALALGHSRVDIEHLLVGLLEESEGEAARTLISLGVNLKTALMNLDASFNHFTPISKLMDIPLSDKLKKAIDFAMREARNLGVNHVGTEHLLLGILSQPDTFACQFLNSLGVVLAEAQREISSSLTTADGRRVEKLSDKLTQKAKTKTPTLDPLGVDLTARAKDGVLDPVIGRSKEIKRVMQVLCRRTKCNPVLVGDPGVGKTAVVEGVAQMLSSCNAPEILQNRRIVQLNVGSLVAGTKYRGEFEERIRRIIKEVSESKEVILFIDEMHMLVGAGSAEGAMDAANMLKPALARGDFQVIGATTQDEYRKYIERDGALERRFQPVKIEEPSIEESVRILYGLRSRYEEHHSAVISDDALTAAANLGARYIRDRFLPDKGIDLIDEASARARLSMMELPLSIKEIEDEISDICTKKESAITEQDFKGAAQLRSEETRLVDKLEEARKEWKAGYNEDKPFISENDIAEIVAEWTGVPVQHINEGEASRLLRMEEEISSRLIGQDEAVSVVSRAVRRARSGLKDPKRPIGSFLFLGPTGVGKTELARCLAKFLFGNEDAIVRIDMSEFMEKHEVSKLMGAPPGYVGHDEGGRLTGLIRKRPYSVVLFDEIEKAHHDVFNLLLQILEDGTLTDGQGRRADFRNTVVIMTSKVEAQDRAKDSPLGFSLSGNQSLQGWERAKKNILSEINRLFKPEFLNRIDDTIVFKPLERNELMRIVEIMLSDVESRLNDQGIEIEISEEVKSLLIDNGFQPKYGARPLRRAIQTILENKLADSVLEGKIIKGSHIDITIGENGISFIAK